MFTPPVSKYAQMIVTTAQLFFLLCLGAGIPPRIKALSSRIPAALVTGSTDGIGLTTAKNLAARGCDVIIHGRDLARIQRAKREIEATIEKKSFHRQRPRVFALSPIDLSTSIASASLASEVDDLCRREELHLTVLLNNAGVFAENLKVTTEGLEYTFAVNVLAPFIITSLLLPRLLQEERSRIVIVSSISQSRSIRDWDDLNYKRRSFSSHAAYSESKLLDAMLAMEFSHRLEKARLAPDKITCNCLDPGTVNTKMLLAGWGPCGIDVNDALDETWLSSSADVDGVTGKYFVGQVERPASAIVYNEWERTIMWDKISPLSPAAAAMWDFDWM